MGKAGGVIGIIAGIFGIVAAVATLLVGGIGSAFNADGANSVVGFGWGGVLFSFLAIVFGAIAIVRPKGASIGLIIVSILGAILGGTLVAICMALSLIGGIVALVASRNSDAATVVSDSTAHSQKKMGRWGWWVAGGGVLVIGLLAVGGQKTDHSNTDPIDGLVRAEPSELSPYGELAELFTIGSKNTDLQRENKLKEITGKVVQWKLPVYEVARSGKGYKVQTKRSSDEGMFDQNLLGTLVYITPRNDAESKIIEALKTGDAILFKGVIAGSTMRAIEVNPAILVSEESLVPSANLSQQISQVPAQPENMMALVGTPPENALEDPLLKGKFSAVLGENLKSFRERLTVSSDIRSEGDWLVGEGGMQHLFSIEEAAFAINSKNGEIFAVMLIGGKEIMSFGTDSVSNLPPPLQVWYKDHGGV